MLLSGLRHKCTHRSHRQSRRCWLSLGPAKARTSALFIVQQWIFNEPVSPFSRRGWGKAVELLKSISIFLDHHLCLVLIISSLSPPPSIYIFSVNNRRTSKWGKGRERFLFCLMWHVDRRKRKFTYLKECSFLFTAAKDELILPFALHI